MNLDINSDNQGVVNNEIRLSNLTRTKFRGIYAAITIVLSISINKLFYKLVRDIDEQLYCPD